MTRLSRFPLPGACLVWVSSLARWSHHQTPMRLILASVAVLRGPARESHPLADLGAEATALQSFVPTRGVA